MRWGPKHTDYVKVRAHELALELLAAGKGNPNRLYILPGMIRPGDVTSVLRGAGFTKERAWEEVKLLNDLVEGRVIRQEWWVSISDAGHACGPTRESVEGEGEIEHVIRYRLAPGREAA